MFCFCSVFLKYRGLLLVMIFNGIDGLQCASLTNTSDVLKSCGILFWFWLLGCLVQLGYSCSCFLNIRSLEKVSSSLSLFLSVPVCGLLDRGKDAMLTRFS